jgi:hypothetical protein
MGHLLEGQKHRGISAPLVFTKRKLEGADVKSIRASVTSGPIDSPLTSARANGNAALLYPFSRYTAPGFNRGRSSRIRSVTRLPTAPDEVFWG